MQILTKEVFLSGLKRSSNGIEDVKKFKDFLTQNVGKSLKKGEAYLIGASDFTDKTEVRLPELKRALTQNFSKGMNKGKVNPHFDAELSKLVEIPKSHVANVPGVASYTVSKFVIAIK